MFARVAEEDLGRFPLTGRGDVNTYALFAELFANLASARGRAGIIVPTGIATEGTTAPFFSALVTSKRLVRLVDFENRARIFPAIDSRMKFSLLTIGREMEQVEFAFFLTDVTQFTEPARRFSLSADDIIRINPNTKTAPLFRSRYDAELTAKLYARNPVLVADNAGIPGDPWSFRYITKMYDMTDDSGIFVDFQQFAHGNEFTSESTRPRVLRLVPLYEAKMVNMFDHRWNSYSNGVWKEPSNLEKSDPDYDSLPRYWVDEADLFGRMSSRDWPKTWLIGWRNITNATNERTIICSIIPFTAVGNTFHIVFLNAPPELCACFVASLNSIVFDYIARQKIGGTHLTIEIAKQLPVLPPSSYSAADRAFIIPRVLHLIYSANSMQAFARDLGYDGPPFAWDEERRAQLRAELDAWYARAYGLMRDELHYILDPADVRGPDYPSETFRVLKKNEIARYGEYRTARLVLAAWDAQEARPAAAQ